MHAAPPPPPLDDDDDDVPEFGYGEADENGEMMVRSFLRSKSCVVLFHSYKHHL